MSNYYLKLRISSKVPWKAREELKQYKSKRGENAILMYRFMTTIVSKRTLLPER
jgi:hypothetical protein